MRLELRRSGGFAAPVLARPVVLDTTALPEHQAEDVARAVAAARACRAPRAGAGGPPGVGADLISYTVTLSELEPGDAQDDVGQGEALTFSDPIPEPAFATLVDLISELGKVQGQ